MRYILALTPPKNQAEVYIQVAQELFSPVHDSYLLSEKVAPHITICQFETDEQEKVSTFWQGIENLKIPPILPRLTGVSFLRGFGDLSEFTWAEISVARDPEIMQIHRFALEVLESTGLKSHNDSGELYRPHITLARIRMPGTIGGWPDTLFADAGKYTISLARGDEHGQYLETLYESRGE